MIGVIFLSLLAGEKCWIKLPDMLKNNPTNITLLNSIQGPLQDCNIPEEIAAWMIKNCHRVTSQTHRVMKHLIREKLPHAWEYLELSTAVSIGEEA